MAKNEITSAAEWKSFRTGMATQLFSIQCVCMKKDHKTEQTSFLPLQLTF